MELDKVSKAGHVARLKRHIGGDPSYHVDKGFSVALVERRMWKKKRAHTFVLWLSVVATPLEWRGMFQEVFF